MKCAECGNAKPLGRDGRCRWRAGCEHRQMVSEAIQGRIVAALTARPCRLCSGPLDMGGFRGDGSPIHADDPDFAMFRESFDTEAWLYQAGEDEPER